jgi:hypothetical protein
MVRGVNRLILGYRESKETFAKGVDSRPYPRTHHLVSQTRVCAPHLHLRKRETRQEMESFLKDPELRSD